MSKQMLIDTTHAEETRVVVLDGSRLDDYDVETSAKKQFKGNIYLAKVVRVEPSLQAAFIEYGGNRHGFLAYGEIHPDYYQIPVADRERLIALQEEEARAEEAREDEEDAADPGREPGAALEAEPFADEFATMPDEPVRSEDRADATSGDEPAADAEPAPQAPAEPEPETMGGETDSEERPPSALSARFLRQYKIQEVIRRRQILLVQVVKEERGNKGAALTTYISLAGRFSVLMPNSPKGGGVSRKITSAADRRRLKEITAELDLPRGMAMIVRTAGAQRPRTEIKRDCEYLLTLWDEIREQTMQAIAPALIYEEANLIKRAIRDVYTRDIEQIVVDGETGWKAAREFMRNLMPANAGKVRLWRDHGQPLFAHHQVEHHLDAMLQPNVQLRSGGYLVINQTEALVAIDVNSGRSTRERGIEETALRTNLEAADEVARQLRLRDLAGLIVIDFIDMESRRHNAMVERRLKEALRNDRARIQVGPISSFGLLEMSRQRLRPSLAESSFVACPHCAGTGFVRGTESSALHVLRAVEEEGAKQRASEILVHVASSVALYILNQKRNWLAETERRHNMVVGFAADDSLIPPQSRVERLRPQTTPHTTHQATPPTASLPAAEQSAHLPSAQASEIAVRGVEVAAEQRLPANGVISHATDPFLAVTSATEPSETGEEPEAPAAAIELHPAAVELRPAEEGDDDRPRRRRRRRRRGGRRDEAGQDDAERGDAAGLSAGGSSAVEAGRGTDAGSDAGHEVGAEIDGAQESDLQEPARQDVATGGSEAPVAPEAVAPEAAVSDMVGPDGDRPRRRSRRKAPATAAAPEMPTEAVLDRGDAAPVADEAALGDIVADSAAPASSDDAEVVARPRRRRVAKVSTVEASAQPKPRRSRSRKPDADPAPAASEPEPMAAAPAEPLVQPILVDATNPPPARRTGWWKR